MRTPDRLRILVVMNQLSRGYAGGDFHAVQVLNRWSSRHDVEVMLPKDSSPQLAALISPAVTFRQPDGRPPVGLSRLLFRYLQLTIFTAWSVWRRRGEWDVVVASTHYPFDVIPILAHGRGLPVVYWHHHFSARRGRPAWLRLLLRFIEDVTTRALKTRRALVFTVSRWTRETLLSAGLLPGDVVMTTNGSSLTEVGDLSPAEDRLLAELEGKRYVLFCARISRLKGSRELRALIPAVLDAGPAYRFVVAGDGPDLEAVRSDVTALGGSQQVLTPGFVSERAKTLLFERAGVVVAPSYEEGWGITVCDALASGRPVVAYDLRAVKDAFPEGPVYVPVGEIRTFVDATLHSLQSDADSLSRPAEFRGWDQIAEDELRVLALPPPRDLASRRAKSGTPRVFLLTSHPVAPPWNSGDKNYARSLLAATEGVTYTYLRDRDHPDSVPASHSGFTIPGRSSMWEGAIPTRREKLRVYFGLLLQRPRVDAVHVVMTFQGGMLPEHALIAVPWLRRHPLLVTCLTSSYLPMRLLGRASAVVTISEATRRELVARGLENVKRIYPGVDLTRWRPESRGDSQRKLGLEPGSYLLFAGHHDLDGGLEPALATMACLRARHPDLKLLLAMRSRPGQRGEVLAADLDRAARALGVADAIIHLGPQADMPAAIGASAGVLFQASSLRWKMELPLVLIESLAAGRPIVTSLLAPLSELQDGTRAVVAGLPRDAAVIDHLDRLVGDDAYFAECSRDARALAEDRHDLRSMVAEYSAFYRALTRSGRERDEVTVG
jgi:glycosyltransferase involved in cell wall biosynthesis